MSDGKKRNVLCSSCDVHMKLVKTDEDYEYYQCEKCGKIVKFCAKKPLIYSRVVGFYSPVSSWNVGKRSEFEDRKVYDVPKK